MWPTMDDSKYANGPAHSFTCADWQTKVGEWATAGINLIIFQAVHDQRWGAYYPSKLPFASPWNGTCLDVVGAVLTGADIVGSKVLLSCEFVHGEDDSVTDPMIMSGRLAIMSELAQVPWVDIRAENVRLAAGTVGRFRGQAGSHSSKHVCFPSVDNLRMGP